jgi:hypothetical protein
MDARVSGGLDRAPCGLDVLLAGTRQCRDHRPADFARHRLDGAELALGSNRESRLNDVYSQAVELMRQA